MGDLKQVSSILKGFKSAKDIEDFLVDLCTPKEMASLAERWKVVRLLDRGLTYRKIQEMTGVSTTTITRVARSMSFGKGYKKAITLNKGESDAT